MSKFEFGVPPQPEAVVGKSDKLEGVSDVSEVLPLSPAPPEDDTLVEMISEQGLWDSRPPELLGEGGGDTEPAVARPELPEGSDASALGKERARPRLIRESQVKVTGPFEITANMRRDVKEMTRSERGSEPFEGQMEISSDRWRKMIALQDAVGEMAKEGGVNVLDRFLLCAEHHIFPRQEDFREAVRQTSGGEPGPGLVGHCNEHGYFAPDTDGPETNLTYVHETIHSVSRRRVELTRTPQGEVEAGAAPFDVAVGHSGYGTTYFREDGEVRTGVLIDEMVTELATTHVATKHVKMEGFIPHGYVEFTVVGFELVEGTAKLHGEEPVDILRQLERGLFIDDNTGLRKLAAYMGEEKFKVLNTTSHLTRELGRLLDMPEAVRKLNAVLDGAELRPSWLLAD